MEAGDRVKTPKGTGVVAYVLPDGSIKVVLDRDLDKPNYTGTVFPAHEVTEVTYEA